MDSTGGGLGAALQRFLALIREFIQSHCELRRDEARGPLPVIHFYPLRWLEITVAVRLFGAEPRAETEGSRV